MAVDGRRTQDEHSVGVGIAGGVKRAREEAGLSQDELAHQLRVHQKTVSRWETGEARLYVDQVLAVDQACGLPIGWVFHSAGISINPSEPEDLLASDPLLSPRWRRIVLASYRSAVDASAEELEASMASSAKKRRSRRS